jgi:succinyl-CoA synthetase beta subunit
LITCLLSKTTTSETKAEEAKEIIDNSGLNVTSAVLLKEAAQELANVMA